MVIELNHKFDKSERSWSGFALPEWGTSRTPKIFVVEKIWRDHQDGRNVIGLTWFRLLPTWRNAIKQFPCFSGGGNVSFYLSISRERTEEELYGFVSTFWEHLPWCSIKRDAYRVLWSSGTGTPSVPNLCYQFKPGRSTRDHRESWTSQHYGDLTEHKMIL